MPMLEDAGYLAPANCFFRLENDRYSAFEAKKRRIKRNWLCGFCDKSFHAEHFLDDHMLQHHAANLTE
jgi:hypothetical protein